MHWRAGTILMHGPDGRVRVWDDGRFPSSSPLINVATGTGTRCSLALSTPETPARERLLFALPSAQCAADVEIFSLRSGTGSPSPVLTLRKPFVGPGPACTALAFAAEDGPASAEDACAPAGVGARHLLVGRADGSVGLWDLSAGREVIDGVVHAAADEARDGLGGVTAVATSPATGSLTLSAGSDGQLVALSWSGAGYGCKPPGARELHRWDVPAPCAPPVAFGATHPATARAPVIDSLVVASDGRIACAPSRAHSGCLNVTHAEVHLYDLHKWRRLRSLGLGAQGVNAEPGREPVLPPTPADLCALGAPSPSSNEWANTGRTRTQDGAGSSLDGRAAYALAAASWDPRQSKPVVLCAALTLEGRPLV